MIDKDFYVKFMRNLATVIFSSSKTVLHTSLYSVPCGNSQTKQLCNMKMLKQKQLSSVTTNGFYHFSIA